MVTAPGANDANTHSIGSFEDVEGVVASGVETVVLQQSGEWCEELLANASD